MKSLGANLSPNVDSDQIVILEYSGKRFAVLSCSVTCDRPNTASICGSDGHVTIREPFHAPTSIEVVKKSTSEIQQFDFPLDEVSETAFNFRNGEGFKYEIEHVRECLLGRNASGSDVMTMDSSVRMAEVTEEVFKQQLEAEESKRQK